MDVVVKILAVCGIIWISSGVITFICLSISFTREKKNTSPNLSKESSIDYSFVMSPQEEEAIERAKVILGNS
jgi:hypothetical protein